MVSLLTGIVLIVAWIVLALGVSVHTGWVHILLGAGAVFLVRAIVLGNDSGPASADVDT